MQEHRRRGQGMREIRSPELAAIPKISSFYNCGANILQVEELPPPNKYIDACFSCHVVYDSYDSGDYNCDYCGDMYNEVYLCELNPKCPCGGSGIREAYIKGGPGNFMVTDDLHVIPLSLTSTLHILREAKILTDKLVEKEFTLTNAQASTLSTVKVSNVSLKASQRDIKEFFSFSGDIVHVEMQCGDELSQVAYITFKDNQGAETAMLLTGATIIDMAVIITPEYDYQLPAAVLAALESKDAKPAGGVESALQKAEDMVGVMLAKGFILGKDALDRAKALDQKHQLTSTATARVSSFDKRIGLSEKISIGTSVVNEKVKEMDQKFQVSEKTKSALAAAEQSVSTAGSAIMNNRYVLTGAAWVTGAFNRVATAATDVGTKAKEKTMAEQDQKNLDDDFSKAHIVENPETIPVSTAASVPTADAQSKEASAPPAGPKKPEPAQGLIL